MKTKVSLFIILSFGIGGFLFCQESTTKNFPLQLSFVYPIGSHGQQSTDFSYNFSLNILTGKTGSIDGFELGGLLNTNIGFMYGLQIGGLGNITNGNVDGMQLSGLFSMADSLNGLQVSGLFSKCTEAEGMQISGILNTSGSSKSAIAGIANINSGNQTGIQIAGIYNQSAELNGVQIGLINKADTIARGVSIGLINLIKKGYYDEWTFTMADYLNLGISYKLGTKQLYTIYSAGMCLIHDPLWVAGLGLGQINEVSPKFSIQPEIICYTYFPMAFTRQLRDTYITHFKLGLVRKLNSHLALSFAPGIYLSIKSNRGIYDTYGYEQSPINPLFDVDRIYSNNRYGFGFGLSIGINFI